MLANEWLDGKYYFKSWGGMYKNEWGKSGDTWYWFNADGTKRTQKAGSSMIKIIIIWIKMEKC